MLKEEYNKQQTLAKQRQEEVLKQLRCAEELVQKQNQQLQELEQTLQRVEQMLHQGQRDQRMSECKITWAEQQLENTKQLQVWMGIIVGGLGLLAQEDGVPGSIVALHQDAQQTLQTWQQKAREEEDALQLRRQELQDSNDNHKIWEQQLEKLQKAGKEVKQEVQWSLG